MYGCALTALYVVLERGLEEAGTDIRRFCSEGAVSLPTVDAGKAAQRGIVLLNPTVSFLWLCTGNGLTLGLVQLSSCPNHFQMSGFANFRLLKAPDLGLSLKLENGVSIHGRLFPLMYTDMVCGQMCRAEQP